MAIVTHELREFETGEACGGTGLAGVGGLSQYPARAIVYRPVDSAGHENVVFVRKNPLLGEYLSYVHSHGIGVRHVKGIDGDHLFTSMLGSPALRSLLQRELMIGQQVQPFVYAETSEHWAQQFGVRRPQWHCASKFVRETLENKILFRDLGQRILGSDRQQSAFANYRVAKTREEVEQAARDMLKLHGTVMVKRPDKASGVGIIKLVDEHDLETGAFQAFAADFIDGVSPIIVEEFFHGEDFSVIFDIRPRKVELLYWTLQYMEDDGKTHAGNTVSLDPFNIFPESWGVTIVSRIVRTIRDLTFKYSSWAREQADYAGIGRVAFDFRANHDGDAILIEANARFSGSTYPYEILEQVIGRPGSPEVVLMHNVNVSTGFKDFRCVADKLDSVDSSMRDDGIGSLIVNPFCIQGEKPKCAIATTARSMDEAAERFFTYVRPALRS